MPRTTEPGHEARCKGQSVIARGGVSPFSRCLSTARTAAARSERFGGLEELPVGQFWKIDLLREGAQTVLVDDLPAIGFNGEVDDLCFQVGRASISTTLNIYTHVVDSSHRKAIEALERELFPTVPKSPDRLADAVPVSDSVN